MSREPSVQVNSREYWEGRFAGDWAALGGREQSRVFMDLLVKFLPAAVFEEIAGEGLSLLDCACAMGDGTAVLAAEFPRSQVGGFDFSPSALRAARQTYPGLDFFAAELESFDRPADVLVASHCFEHLDSPMTVLRRLAAQARRYLLVLTPFLESYPPHHEHRRVIHASTLPEEVDGWRVTQRMVLPPVAQWRGNQLLLLYQPVGAAAEVALAPLPSVVEIDQQMRLRTLEEGLASLTAEREQAVVERAQAAREREREVKGLADRLAAAEREREELRVEVESWRWDATSARRELTQLQSSRLWHVATVYWGIRRRLGLLKKPESAGAAAQNPSSSQAAAPSASLIPPAFPRVPAGRYDVVVFSIIDWDFRFQRPQQIATQLGRHGHRVLYVSASRFLPPDGPAWTLAWKAKNVVEVALRSRRALDVYRGRLEEADLGVLEDALGGLLRSLALGDVVSLVQIPFWAPLADRLRERYGWRV